MRGSGRGQRTAPAPRRQQDAVSGSLATRWGVSPLGLSVLLAAGLAFQPAGAQPIDEYQFKAAILYNMAKFVEWPPEALRTPTQPIVICVLGDSPIHAVLKQAVGGKPIENHAVTVRRISERGEAADCQILFVPVERTRWRGFLENLKSGGVLTVGENDRFVGEGGVANLKTEGGKVRIQVNTEAAQRARLTISSKLLALAEIVRK